MRAPLNQGYSSIVWNSAQGSPPVQHWVQSKTWPRPLRSLPVHIVSAHIHKPMIPLRTRNPQTAEGGPEADEGSRAFTAASPHSEIRQITFIFSRHLPRVGLPNFLA